ncbi:MAG: EamA family transporter [Actinobacteria bacterium]|nr:EamA family transporter [Actinomycetota bacterium]
MRRPQMRCMRCSAWSSRLGSLDRRHVPTRSLGWARAPRLGSKNSRILLGNVQPYIFREISTRRDACQEFCSIRLIRRIGARTAIWHRRQLLRQSGGNAEIAGRSGVMIVVGPWKGMGAAVWIGVIAVLLANMIWGWSGPFSRRYLTGGIRAGTVEPLALAAGMFVMGSVAVIPVATVVPVMHSDITTSGLIGILFLGVFSSGIATTMNLRVIGRADATTASTALYLAPLVAVLIGTVFLGETLSWNEPLGGVVILLGAALAQGLLRFGDRNLPLQPDDV